MDRQPHQDRFSSTAAQGLYFAVFVPTSGKFHAARLAVDGVLPDGANLRMDPYNIPDSANGINAMIRAGTGGTSSSHHGDTDPSPWSSCSSVQRPTHRGRRAKSLPASALGRLDTGVNHRVVLRGQQTGSNRRLDGLEGPQRDRDGS